MARRSPNVLLQSFITGQLAGELLRRELEPASMGPNEFGVLSVADAFGPLTPTDLATRLGMAAPTLSAWIGRLTASGRMTKLPHPTDRRSYLLEVTAEGREALREAHPRFGAALERLEAGLGDDLEHVWAAGRRFEEALRDALDSSSDTK